MVTNNLWQFISIIYNEKTGFNVCSTKILIITWKCTKHNRNPIGLNNNDGFIQLLTDISDAWGICIL